MKPLFENLPARQKIKNLMLKFPGGKKCLEFIGAYYRRRVLKRFAKNADLFTYFYQSNSWGHPESRSGEGSTLIYTENIRREIPRLIDSLNIKRILDAPCGDYNWFKHIQRESDIYYTGGDIVVPLVEKNNIQFGNSNTRFIVLDILEDPLPDADLWLCRDCLFHLPNDDIVRALNGFRKSKIHYILTTIYPECLKNLDIITGEFRHINLQMPPFSLCPPQFVIDDWMPGYPVRQLALWARNKL